MGDSKFRNGAGIGEKPGEIFPADLEPTILALNAGQLTVKETEAGLHVLRVAERTRAGLRPYDEKLQAEVKRKLQAQSYDREVRRLLDSLWKRTQPQIWAEGDVGRIGNPSYEPSAGPMRSRAVTASVLRLKT